MGELVRGQFKKIAEVIAAVERSVQALVKAGSPGMPVKAVDMLCERVGMTHQGAEILIDMILQSDIIEFSEDLKWIVLKPYPDAIEVTVTPEGVN